MNTSTFGKPHKAQTSIQLYQTGRATCHRCGRPAPRKGRLSASVEVRGRVRRQFICAQCVGELQGGAGVLVRPPAYQTALEGLGGRRAA